MKAAISRSAWATLQEDPPPVLDLMDGHLDLAGNLIDRLTPDHAQHNLRLPLRTPALG